MMIRGIGTDIVEIERIKPGLIRKILSEPELVIYNSFGSETRKAEFLAGRFAVKEAISKALSHLDHPLSLPDMIVLNDNNGKPYLICDKVKDLRFLISISHERQFAVGFCIVETIDL